ncbi:ABC transporter permease [Sphingosinicella terrae]|uniref:ABC transporter permease n=1 Tax=Sphingosinicella terrae TaxID=2172047 RepID=UPI000E0D4448|nr:ABC transporter permease [Sphingosinicella terrae]
MSSTYPTPPSPEAIRVSGSRPRLPWFALALLAPVLVFGIFGPLLFLHDPTAINLMTPQKPPVWLAGGEWAYPLGTDQLGRDLLSRLMEGARVSLTIAAVGVLLAAMIGITAGMAAGYFGGFVDTIISQIVDIKMSIPATLLIILLGAVIGGGLVTIVVSVIFLFWADYARIIRAEALSLRERGYVLLAKVANAGHGRILRRHILPNLFGTCIVLVTLQVGRAILIEAGISFIGLGVQPPATAWGMMVFEGRSYLSTAWWLPTFSGLAITITVLGTSLFGDWLRDRLDTRASAL